ncbi:unnamed protein product [marine sediment metagenome]|uniref:Uncharacterized protein n=1 Tax=marine sediment metagenome TaxID=412755 RepID=X1LT51_9ZZZZ
MPELPGDANVTKLFGFPGFEALIRVMVSHINKSKDEHAKPHVTYEEFRTEIEAKMVDINNETP